MEGDLSSTSSQSTEIEASVWESIQQLNTVINGLAENLRKVNNVMERILSSQEKLETLHATLVQFQNMNKKEV